MITDADGNYYFQNLVSGNYQVAFSDIPSHLVFTQQNTPGDNQNNTNSDANTSTGRSSVIALSASEVDMTIDAGLKPLYYGSVGTLVWHDENMDGLRTANEALIPGVTVTLYTH